MTCPTKAANLIESKEYHEKENTRAPTLINHSNAAAKSTHETADEAIILAGDGHFPFASEGIPDLPDPDVASGMPTTSRRAQSSVPPAPVGTTQVGGTANAAATARKELVHRPWAQRSTAEAMKSIYGQCAAR